VLLGALLLYFVTFFFLPQLPGWMTSMFNADVGEFASRLKFLVFGLILVVVMLVRPEGLLPSRERQQELKKGTHDDTIIEDVNAAAT